MEIKSSQVILIIQQFLLESGLKESLSSLQRESGLVLESIQSKTLATSIISGDWLTCLTELSQSVVQPSLLLELYEEIVRDWIQQGEIEGARILLRQTEPMLLLRDRNTEKYLALEALLTDPKQSEQIPLLESKKKRLQISDKLHENISSIKPGRLLQLLGQSLKHQSEHSLINPHDHYDLLHDSTPHTLPQPDVPISTLQRLIKFPKNTIPTSLAFSPHAKYFAVGLNDGFVEIYNYMTGKLSADLVYQQKDEGLLMDSACLSLSFSKDSKLIVGGGFDGSLFVWDVITGAIVRQISAAHGQGVSFVSFNSSGTHILSASYDSTVKIHGLKSGKALKVFRVHSSYVNSACYSVDESVVLTGSSDGTVKVFNSATCEIISTFKFVDGIENSAGINLRTIHSVIPLKDGFFLVGNQSNYIYLTSIRGKIEKAIKVAGEVIAVEISANQEFVYAALADRKLVCVSVESGEVVGETKIDDEVVGMRHHPFANYLGVYGDANSVAIFGV